MRADDAHMDPWQPGRCQVCDKPTMVKQRWPRTTPGRYVDVCVRCDLLTDLVIGRAVNNRPWSNGAVI